MSFSVLHPILLESLAAVVVVVVAVAVVVAECYSVLYSSHFPNVFQPEISF